MTLDLEGRPAALVIAASRGMGAAIAKELAKTHDLVLMSRSADVEALSDGLGATAVRGDLRNANDLARLVETATSKYGRIDGVVTSGGHPPKGQLLELSDEQWREGYDLILQSVMTVCRLITPVFKAQGSGRLVAISSYAALTPEPTMPVSSVMRAGLQAWIKLYAREYGRFGIRANAILPGYIETHAPEPDRIASIPAGRYGEPDEVGRLAALLLSPGTDFLSGQSILIDGAMVSAI